MIPFILTQNQLTMVINNKPYTIDSDHLNYDRILDELRGEQNPALIIGLVEIPLMIQSYINKTSNELIVDLEAGLIMFNNKEVDSVLVNRILTMYKEGFDVTPMVNFMSNLYQNPSQRAIEELYGFLEYGKLPITEDGYFLAYKKVNKDYSSVHDSSFKNVIGTVVSMPRDKVNADSAQTCSSGLHLCSHEYLSSYGGDRILILKVNPKDVVSIPTDYNNTKARACAYAIIGELGQPDIKTVNQSIPVMTESVADLSDYTLETPIVGDIYSDWFRSAYTIGYEVGKNKRIFNPHKLTVGDIYYPTDPDDEEYAHHLTQQQATDANLGYETGYKHGKGHAKRLVPKMSYHDIAL